MSYYKISGEKLEVEFDSFGGTLHSVKDVQGLEYLWQGDQKYWSGQAPVLFPICGSIRDDRAVLQDAETVCMPRHGIVRKREFTLEEQTKNGIVFSVESDEEMKNQFPFDFKLYTKYVIEGTAIAITYEVENRSEKRMPFFIGGHPGFNCPLKENERYDDYFLEFEQTETCSVPTPVTETGLIDMERRSMFLDREKKLPLKHELFRKDAVILDELKSRKVKLLSAKSKVGVELDFRDFPYLILWSSGNDGPFVALEPWIGLSTCSDESDVFEEKRNVQFAEPGEKKSYKYSIRIL